MSEKWTQGFFIHSFDVNHLGHATPVALLKIMQEAAWRHAESLELGYGHLKDAGMLWVLSRMRVQVDRYPAWGEEIVLETWPSGLHRLFVTRDFRITDAAGTALSATSSWIVLDAESRRPVRPQVVVERHRELSGGEMVLGEPAGKVELPEIAEETVADAAVGSAGDAARLSRRLQVRVSDLDTQRHVNNARYLEWCLDEFSAAHYEEWEPVDMTMNFLAEARFGDTGRVDSYLRGGDGAPELESTHAVYRDGDGAVFGARIRWLLRG